MKQLCIFTQNTHSDISYYGWTHAGTTSCHNCLQLTMLPKKITWVKCNRGAIAQMTHKRTLQKWTTSGPDVAGLIREF